MIKVQSVRFGAIPGLLLLCTVALVACNDSQNSVFAQGNSSAVPENELLGFDRVFPTASLSAEDSGTNDGTPDSSGSNSDSESQSTTQDDDETTAANEEEETSTTNEEEETSTTQQGDIASYTGLDKAITLAETTVSTISEAFSAAGLPTLNSET
ncbi:MAG: hypothetical protein WCF07_07645 [Nitrososphaeraceae archaeon]